MTNPDPSNAEIDCFMAQFMRAMGGVPRADREEFAAEIRSHLMLRSSSVGAAPAIEEMGSPEHCAAGFLDELRLQAAMTDGAPAASFAALTAVSGRKALAAIGVLFAACFYLFALAFLVTACVEVVAPDLAGVWYNSATRGFQLGVFIGDHPGFRELAGWTLLPLSLALAVGLYLLGAIVSRRMVSLLLSRTLNNRRPRSR